MSDEEAGTAAERSAWPPGFGRTPGPDGPGQLIVLDLSGVSVEEYAKLVDALKRLYSADDEAAVLGRLDIDALDAALRQFDGDWDRLARQLTGVSEWSEAVTVVTPSGVATDHLPRNDWWSDWLRTRAVVLAGLYLTFSVSAEQVWPELVANLRDNAIAAIAIYSAYVAWSKGKGG